MQRAARSVPVPAAILGLCGCAHAQGRVYVSACAEGLESVCVCVRMRAQMGWCVCVERSVCVCTCRGNKVCEEGLWGMCARVCALAEGPVCVYVQSGWGACMYMQSDTCVCMCMEETVYSCAEAPACAWRGPVCACACTCEHVEEPVCTRGWAEGDRSELSLSCSPPACISPDPWGEQA